MQAMPAITLWPEWWPTFLHMGKHIENRPWEPPRALLGRRIALHCGKAVGGSSGRRRGIQWLHDAALGAGWHIWFEGSANAPALGWRRANAPEMPPRSMPLVLGAVVATARLVRVEDGLDDPWAMADQKQWVLADLRPLETPVPARGHQRLWYLQDLKL